MSRGKMKKKNEDGSNPSFVNEFKLRLKMVRKELKMTQTEFAKELGISKPTYVRYELGQMYPPISILDILIRKFSINGHWFIKGEGDMFQDMNSEDLLSISLADPRKAELFNYMQVPEIEQIILAKLEELKIVLKLDPSKFPKLRNKTINEDKIPEIKKGEAKNVLPKKTKSNNDIKGT